MKEKTKDILGVILLYAIVIIGIVLINARLGEQNKSAVAETTTQYTR